MPKISQKRKLLDQICLQAYDDIQWTRTLHDEEKVLDGVIEDILLACSYRYLLPRQLVPKSDQWYINILPSLDDSRFKQFMRVQREDFGRILSMIENNKVFKNQNKKRQLNVDLQLAISLFKFGCNGTGSSIHKVASLFGIGDGGTIHLVVNRVIQVQYCYT